MEQCFFLGRSSIEKLLPILREYSPRHIFLVRGKKSYEICGAKSIMDSVFDDLCCEVTEYYDFEENPKIEDLERGLLLMKRFSFSVIVAVGGGSVLDMAKLLRFFSSYSGEPTSGKFEKRQELLPLIALPTTAGTGSEATHFAVLYKDKVKYSVEHAGVLPDTAIVYPPFTYNNPKYLTACTGFDALAQAIEAYWNVNATAESDGYAEKAIKLLWSNLPLAVNSPTDDVRDKVSEGSYWAGRAINITKTTAPHAFSYPFTTYYGYPHGHAVALIFPYFFEYNILFTEALSKRLLLSDYLKKMHHLLVLLDMNIETFPDVLKHFLALLHLEKKQLCYSTERILAGINLSRLKNNPIDISFLTAQEFVRKIANR